MPSSVRSRMTPNRSSISRSVSVAVGSSMITTFASMASALAISTRCWAATGRLPARRDGSTSSPTRSSSSRA